MAGRERKSGEYIPLTQVAAELNTSPPTIIKAVHNRERSGEPIEPPLNMQGTWLHRDEVARVGELVNWYRENFPLKK